MRLLSTAGLIGFISTAMLTAFAAPQRNQAQITDSAAATAAPTNFPTMAAVAAQAMEASALGSAHVRNSCGFPVYVYVCKKGTCGGILTLPAHTGTYTEKYTTVFNDGHSIKIGRAAGEGPKPILQFEYTNSPGAHVYYDLSEINGHPFDDYGVTLTTTDSSCFHKHCPPHDTNCGFYEHRGEGDAATKSCSKAQSIGVTLCG
ncbi:MAG: hypothetical protein M1828_005981 [Chrysothrix sp. TS-e1954]|nr:MAG: hypothetical protein M1828_005981 [Chrysothrix sp. TS-e1954]